LRGSINDAKNFAAEGQSWVEQDIRLVPTSVVFITSDHFVAVENLKVVQAVVIAP